MHALDLVNLRPLMKLTSGQAETAIALIDGPVAIDHPDLASENIRAIPGRAGGACTLANSNACTHGTFVAGILSAKRGSAAPAISPGCTLLLRPIFSETASKNGQMPEASPEELATAIIESVEAGARVLNLSVALATPSSQSQIKLEQALDHAARRGVIVVAAAGNQGTIGSSAITRHQWVIPVAACDDRGRPISQSNLGSSIGRRGLSAPGSAVTSLATNGESLTSAGTSIATPFVTGAVALLWSEFPAASATQIKLAVTRAHLQRRATVTPPLLDAWAGYQLMATTQARRRIS